MIADEPWAGAAGRWAEAAGLLRSAGRVPVDLRAWLGAGWSGPAAAAFDVWSGTFEQASRRAAGALSDAAAVAGRLATTADAGGAGHGLGAELSRRLDAGARAVVAVPVPGERTPGRGGPPATPMRAAPGVASPVRPPPAVGARRREERVRGWIDEAVAILRQRGYPPAQLDPDAIATIIRHESSGDPAAVNRWDSNAARGTPSMGLMQTIAPTFERWRLPGHHQSSTRWTTSSPGCGTRSHDTARSPRCPGC